MLDFKVFKTQVQDQLDMMSIEADKLFIVDVSKDELWNTWLESFPEEANPIVNERREYDCNTCKQFIKYSGIVFIKNNKLVTMYDIETEYPFDIVAKKMSDLIKSREIRDVFIAEDVNFGTDKNRQLIDGDKVIVWDHMYFKFDRRFVRKKSESIPTLQNSFRTNKQVFKRSMIELTLDAGLTILELIDQGSLYRGEEHKPAIQDFIKYKREFDKLSESERDNWCWKKSINNPIVRIRNTAIGTLLIDLSEELDLDTAVKKFFNVMAPTNYKRPKNIFTKKMVEQAQKKIVELGLNSSLGRRHSVLEDITYNNVLFVNRDAQKKMSGDVFDDLMKEAKNNNVKKFDKVEEVTIEDFVKNILPNVSNIELMVENKHINNLMTLISPEDKDAPSMFKWNNNFSWSYNGEMADSLKENVKSAGGDVNGVLRFSIQWNENKNNQNDLDAHAVEPSRNVIYYGSRTNPRTTGKLDVDIIDPGVKVAVENITWTNIHKMGKGKYCFYVNNFSNRNGEDGFRAEIEFDGKIYSYDYPKYMKHKEKVKVADVTLAKDGTFSIKEHLSSTTSSKEVWGINTHTFSKVSVMMFSPNYWDDQKGIGNKHYFFFLEGCVNQNNPRGFYNEFLRDDLMEHKRVFEALGSKMRVDFSENQLSGLGFSSTQRNEVIVKVDGTFTRMLKIKF